VVASSVCTMLWKHGAIMLPHSSGNCDTAQQHLGGHVRRAAAPEAARQPHLLLLLGHIAVRDILDRLADGPRSSSNTRGPASHRRAAPAPPTSSSVASRLSNISITSASWRHFHPLHTSRTVAGALQPSLRPKAHTAQHAACSACSIFLSSSPHPLSVLPTSAATCRRCARASTHLAYSYLYNLYNRHVPCPTQLTHATGLWVARNTARCPFSAKFGIS
jgi:hypothetical protein